MINVIFIDWNFHGRRFLLFLSLFFFFFFLLRTLAIHRGVETETKSRKESGTGVLEITSVFKRTNCEVFREGKMKQQKIKKTKTTLPFFSSMTFFECVFPTIRFVCFFFSKFLCLIVYKLSDLALDFNI